MPPSPTLYEQILAPLHPYLPGMRKLVRDHGPDAIHVLLEDFKARRIDASLVGTLSHALTVAHIEEAMDQAPSFTDYTAVVKDADLWHQAEVKMDLRNVPEPERLPLFVRDVTLNWTLLAFARAGRQEYEVSPGLATKLANTELRGLVAEDLQLPHPALSIQVPREAGLATTGPFGTIPVEEFYIVEGTNPVRNWLVYTRTAGGESIDAPAQDLKFTILLPDGRSLDECIDVTTQAQALAASGGLPDTLVHHEETTIQSHSPPGELDQWTSLFRWAMNVVLYATNSGLRREVWRNAEALKLRDRLGHTPASTKREKLKAELRALDKQRRIILGPDVELEVLDGGAGTPLTIRVRVQGHWKRQPYGPNKADRKIIWIQPYWRGPEDPPAPLSTRHTLV